MADQYILTSAYIAVAPLYNLIRGPLGQRIDLQLLALAHVMFMVYELCPQAVMRLDLPAPKEGL